ncbi:fimbrial protein [Erwinia billingiae]|uniref:fimbrial protein n=1 Tax=Erwinia billingiae TaxID=182337 RepID=UPI00320B517E
MKLNKLSAFYLASVAAPLLAVLCGVSASAYAATDQATITVSGTVKSNTCTIEKTTFSPTLPPVSDRDIKGVGKISSVSSKIPVILKNCGAGVSTVKVTASGDQGPGKGDYFANSVAVANGGANGVGIIFYKTDGAPFNSTGSITENSKLTASADTTLNYEAKYIGTSDTVSAGTVKTAITMKFEYQ